MTAVASRRLEATRKPGRRDVLARAFGITALLSMGGSLLGLLRDLLLARYYGADQGTDAFLVSWTVPETAAPLLIEDAMAFLMVPAFSLALADRGPATGGPGPAADTVPAPRTAADPDEQQATLSRPADDPAADAAHDPARDPGRDSARDPGRDAVRDLVAATLPPLALLLSALSAATALGAPVLVHLLAPGLADPGLAVVCTRLTAITVLPFGLTGYLGSGLRAHQRFTASGAVYIAYNTGILAVMVLLHGSLGVRAAAAGVALGSVLMTAILLPPFARHCAVLTPRRQHGPRPAVLAISPIALLPIALFTLTRQSQVFVERYLASSLTPGTISHLNYAEKVAQMAMTLGVMVCTVTFPVVARALAQGDTDAARRRVEKDLGVVGAVVLAGTSVLLACAPQVVALLFERGAFTARDTAATAAVMRVYSLGLLGQAMVSALVRPFFSTRPAVAFGTGGSRVHDRSDWFPLAAMGLGLLVTAVLGATTASAFGALGLAAANATGISLTAVLLLAGLRAHRVPIRIPAVLLELARLVLAAAASAVAAAGAAGIAGPHPLPAVLLGGLAGPAVFVLTAVALRTSAVTGPLAVLSSRARSRFREGKGLPRPQGRTDARRSGRGR